MGRFQKSFYDWCIENNKSLLLDRWNYDLNKTSPKSVGYKSNNKFYFNCDKDQKHTPGYIKLSSIVDAGGKITCKACNSFAQWCIDNISQDFFSMCWDDELNLGIDPWMIAKSSHKTIYLKCENGFEHFYPTTPHNFIIGSHKCQVCSGQAVFKGFNDLFTTNPELMHIWDFDKNTNINPDMVSHGSSKRVWWKCDVCGHSWKTSVSNIAQGKRCPVCAVKKTSNLIRTEFMSSGYSVGDNFPELLPLWDYQKNLDISPFNISPSSRKRICWKCENGHSFKKSIIAMCKKVLNEESLCEYCSGMGVIIGQNDLYSSYPELVDEWNYDKNIGISPHNIAYGSTKKVWWKCKSCGYEWMTSPNSRTNRSSGCPECARHFNTSRLQLMVEKYIENKYGFEILHERDCTIIPTNPKTGYKLPYDNDICVNNRRLIIEVHGQQHYQVTIFTITNANKKGVTPEEEFEYQKYKDQIKKEYAIKNGYEYLEIPYYAINNNLYKDIIDSKINEILYSTIQD